MHLHGEKSHVDGVLDNDARHIGFFLLTNAEEASEGLLLYCMIPLQNLD